MIILLLGECGVGKTAISNAFFGLQSSSEAASSHYFPTVGLDIREKPAKVAINGKMPAPIQVWDVSGAALDDKNLFNAIFMADIILFVYDVTHLGSFKRLEAILKKIRTFFGLKPVLNGDKVRAKDIRLPYISLVASKVDLEKESVVPISMHDSFHRKGQFHNSYRFTQEKADLARTWLNGLINDLSGVKGVHTGKTEVRKIKQNNAVVKDLKKDIHDARTLRERGKDAPKDSACIIS